MERQIFYAIQPLHVRWNPKPDITAYELAQCLPYLNKAVIMPDDIDMQEPFTRHFVIYNPNKTQP